MSLVRYTAALLPAAVLGAATLAIPDDNRMVQQDGLIRYPVIPKQGGPIFGKHSNFTKRQIDTGSLSQRSGTLYTIEVTLGTPGQTVPVQFDTGSSELWVNPVCSKSTTPEFCNAQPRFTESSTLVDLDAQGHVTYGTGYADFEYIADYVGIGSARITQQIFGVAFDSAHAIVGLMGAGPSLEGWENGYPLVVDSLAQQGLTNSRAFSMDLRDFDSARGSVIFGGIDTKKYSGTLVKCPIIPAAQSPDGLTRFWLYVNGISVNQPDGNVVTVYSTPTGGKGQPVLLDSGYTLSALPAPIMQNLVSAFPSAEYLPDDDLYVVDCLDPGQGGSLDFTFGDKVINVPYYDFVWHVPDSDLCVLGAFTDDFPVLGDTFLRAAYVVYDWDNRMIHLGQSDDCGSELAPIGSGLDAVPSVAGCGQTTPTSTLTTSSAESTSTTEPETSTTAAPGTTSTTTSEPSTETSSEPSTETSTEPSTESGTETATESSTTSESSTASGSTSSTTAESSATSSPESSTATEPPSSTTHHTVTTTSPTLTRSTITTTTSTTYTITSCPPTIPHCPLHHLTTEIITATTTICPESTATYTIHPTLPCISSSSAACPSAPPALTVTVSPLPPAQRTTAHGVPGCTPGAPGPSGCVQCGPGNGGGAKVTTLVAAVPTAAGCVGCPPVGGGNGTVTTAGVRPTGAVVTGGVGAAAVGMGGWGVVGVVVVVVGVLGL
ncbi:aspartic peptidase domain-containing protein [Chaetomium sp. MPI-CAGE-AT-0009]|nr:aspartic peptidase domain-containing protein [Chaetomium sp. MPI-CAGE-AT-0009]